MKSYREGGQVRLGSLLLILSLAAAVLYPSRSAHAEDIEIGSSNTESLNFAVYNTTPGITPSTGQPIFSSNGMLMDAGSQAFPVLGMVSGNPQTFSQTNGDAYTTILSANQAQLPSSFGTAAFSTSASAALANNGTNVSQQGVAFNSATPAMPGMPATPGTFLQSASTLSNFASVSFASLHADFTNSTGFGAASFSGVPGVAISATGNLSSTAGSFVELANQGTITIKDNMGNLIATNPFTIIVGFAFNSTLTNNTYLYGTGTTSVSPPDPTTGAFSVLDTNSFPSVTIPIGGTFSVDSNLTLVSDPGSLIKLADLSGAPDSRISGRSWEDLHRLPPYPSHRAWSRSEPSCSWSPDCGYGGVSGAIAARLGAFRVLVPVWLPWWFSSSACLRRAWPRPARITVNDLAQPLSASSEGFATT